MRIDNEQLKRIATALESIADSLKRIELPKAEEKPKTSTPFPWERVSVRTRKSLYAAVAHDKFGEFAGYTWPLSCEDLQTITRVGLQDKKVRNFGQTSMSEVSSIMRELGYKDW